MKMAASSPRQPAEEHPNSYPYPSHVFVPIFVTVKLSGRDMYDVWRTQMLCLLESHDMLLGFITVPGGNVDDKLWRRSDALVKGWILGSLSEQVLVNFVKENCTDFTARDLWDGLQTIYGPNPPQQAAAAATAPELDDEITRIKEESTIEENVISEDAKSKEQKEAEEKEREEAEEKEREEANQQAKLHQSLYEATQSQNYNKVYSSLNKGEVAVTDKITINGNTVLHLTIGTTKDKGILERMLNMVPEGSLILDLKNSEGSTLLHVAAIVGNTNAAEILTNKNKDLLFVTDKDNCTPLAKALSNMHTDTFFFLWNNTPDIEKATLFVDTNGDDLLVNAISSKDYKSASEIIKYYSTFDSDSVLMALAQNFPCKLHKWGETAYKSCLAIFIHASVIFLLLKPSSRWMIYPRIVGATFLTVVVIYAIYISLKHIILVMLDRSDKEGGEMYDDATDLFKAICKLIKSSKDSRSHHDYYNHVVLEATRLNAYEFVVMIVDHFPNAIWSANGDGHGIIQHAVVNRSEKVYNLLYQMSEHRNMYRTIKDLFGNNLLHLAARLAPPDKLTNISGAALQIQRELQWFKEVEGFICPLNIKQKNQDGDTPQMVFTREHKELVIEGEKWMKATAESYTITAALITTIMFASAITVPGGNNQDTGIPVFNNHLPFTIFAASVAVSLFTSVTSLLMFLSILTTRFAERDFLFKLPTKLIIGLTTLLISTTAMIVAFGATLFLLFGGRRHKWILIPIAALTSLPITSFVTLQFPLIADLVRSTYGRRIFGKKRHEPFY